jgi:hypothetical protein
MKKWDTLLGWAREREGIGERKRGYRRRKRGYRRKKERV